MRCLVTAALPYVNAIPHIGNIVGSHLPADIFARYLRSKGHDVLFVGGSDEHGTPNVLAAREHGLPVEEFCARLHEIHARIYRWFDISYDIFSRTSKPLHHEVTRDFFDRVRANGHIQEGDLEQFFCPKDERFLPDRYVEGTCPHCRYRPAYGDQCERCGRSLEPRALIDPACKICGARPALRTSRHLFLRFDRIAPRLEEWIGRAEHWRPQVRAIAQGWLREGLRERCITRDLEWGVKVPIPGFTDKVFYVWFDAPIGYITFTREAAGDAARFEGFWRDPGTRIFHWLGKDNIYFHSIFWPGMLMAEGTYSLPHRVDGLQFLNYEGQKISKSKKWGIFCERLPEAGLDVDILRGYLTFLIPETGDTEFRWDDLERRVNGELIGTFANFVNRTISLARSKLGGEVVRPADGEMDPLDLELAAAAARRAAEADRLLEAGELRTAFSEVLGLAADGNRYFDRVAPWKLAKSAEDRDRARAARVLWLCAAIARSLAVLAAPFLPRSAARIYAQLAIPGRPDEPGRYADAGRLDLPERHVLGEPQPLFRKLAPEEVERARKIATEPSDLAALLELPPPPTA